MSPAMMSAPSDSHKANVEWKLKLDKLTLLLDIPEQWKEGLVSSYIELVTKTELQWQSNPCSVNSREAFPSVQSLKRPW